MMRAGTSPMVSWARTSENSSTGTLDTAATNTAPASCASPMLVSCRVGASPRKPGAATRNANQCAIARPTAVPQTIARSWVPTGPVTRPCAKWSSGRAASSAISTTDTYSTMVAASRSTSARCSAWARSGSAVEVDVMAESSLGDARAVHLQQWVRDELEALTIGPGEVERRPADVLSGYTGSLELRAEVLPSVRSDRDRDVVQAPEHLGVLSEVQAGEVEERQEVPVADVEEEMGRTLVVAILEQLGERKLEQP